MRIIGSQPVHHIVNTEHISVPELSLSVCRQEVRAYLGELPVHIPLDVLNVCTVEYLSHKPVDIVPDLLIGVVKHILLTAHCKGSALYLYSPVGVSLVKLGVGRDHLRLKPDTELHSQLVDLINKVFKSALKLFLINEPVTQRRIIRISVTEPAVVHNKHLNTKL